MEIIDLISRLKDSNIDLSLAGSDLEVRFDGEAIPGGILEEIKGRKSEIITFLKNIGSVKVGNIVTVPPQFSYSLSPGQRRLWILSQFEEGNIAYNMPGVYVFEGLLDMGALEHSIRTLISRHESLRTVFKEDEKGEIRQFIHPPEVLSFRVDYMDLRHEGEREEKIKSLVLEEAVRPFDLAAGPLLRAGIYQMEAHKWIFTYTMHHIIGDGWSMDILIKELLLLYKAYTLGMENPLAPLPIQYKDYAYWQQEQLSGDSLLIHKEYWLKQFEGELPVLDLPGERERPSVKTYNGGVIHKIINKESTKAIRAFNRDQGGSLFMCLLTAVDVLLYRYTNQKDIIVGTPIAGRDHMDLENQIGFYLNTLALRARFDGQISFSELFQYLKEITTGAYEHQVYPFDELIEELRLQRDTSRNALFDVMILLQSTGASEEKSEPLEDLKISRYQGAGPLTSKFDLTFTFVENPADIHVRIEYNSDVYDPGTIDRLGDHLIRILTIAVSAPLEPIGEIDYLSESEKHRLLIVFNDTGTDLGNEKTLVDLFEEQVDKTPDAVALVFEEVVLTYKELNESINRLGDYLQKNYNIQADDLIGIKLYRSEWMLITMLAILKSGGGYVPIDPEYPQERIEYLIADSACKVVIGEELLQNIRTDLFDYARSNPEVKRAGSDLAYCIYTSGSTGKPKGCLLSHRNVVNFFVGMNRFLGTQPATILSITNYTFDISVLELIWPLTVGYKIVLQRNSTDLSALPVIKKQPLAFSLFYFGNADDNGKQDKYKLLLEGAKYADNNGYTAVWTPERHFHEFGGLYPSPSVTGAALSTITNNIGIRAGSVVLPLHNPLQVAEEWSVIDNLSNGRAGISCASGWHANDFVLFPENYKKRHEIMYERIDMIRKLWRGEGLPFVDGNGTLKETKIFPTPIQKELPIWVTSANSVDTFIAAGKLGLNVLTHLLGETVEGLAVKIAAYHKAYRESGHDINNAKVALMLHTYIDEDIDKAYEKARAPFINYLRTSIGLLKNLAAGLNLDIDADSFSAEDMDALLEYSFQRYVSSASLIGTKESCMRLLDKLGKIGVNEIACLIDFGIDYEAAMKGLSYLTDTKTAYNVPSVMADTPDYSVHVQLERHHVTHLQATPSMALLLKTGFPASCSLRKVLLGGERLPIHLVKDLYNELPESELYNMYGPTETTIWSTCCKIDRQTEKISIGTPIANTQIYILDENRRLLPLGREGEIYIGGEGVARSYRNKPELSAERFIENPFLARGRLYRTGDFGKWLPDGNIEYTRRKDDQVKIQGHRIEPGEIERALQHTGLITNSVVVSRLGVEGETELVAYVVSDQPLKVPELRTALMGKLPRYMLPSHYVQLDALPLTHNGKINRQRLPDPQGLSMDMGMEYLAPRTATEQQLVLIWQKVLGKDKVGIKDNFFELGGNSIKVARLAGLINREFEVKIGFRELFSAILLEEQAQIIHHAEKTKFTSIQPVPVRTHYPLSSFQRRLWVLSQFEESNVAYNMPGVHVFEGTLDLSALERSFSALIARHESLRTVFKADEQGNIRQFIHPPEKSSFKIVCRDFRQEEEPEIRIREVAQAEIVKPFDLSEGPLLRADLYHISDTKWLFTYVLHHIVGDGWSMEIFIRELLLLYNAFIKGESPILEPLRIQYKDYAAWQQEQLSGDTLKRYKAWWLQQFEGPLPVLDLRGDRPRPAVKTYNGGIVNRQIDPGTCRNIRSLCQEQGATLFMGLLAVVNTLLYRYTNQKDIITGSPIAGREHIDLEDQIGFYLNTLAIRTRFSNDDNYKEVLERIKQVTLQAYEYQAYPFDELVDQLSLTRDMSRNALFDVMVSLQNVHRSNEEKQQNAENLRISSYQGMQQSFSKFDLTFNFMESGDDLWVRIEYNSDLFDRSMVDRLSGHFEHLLEAIIRHPSTPVACLEYLDDTERQQLLVTFNDTHEDYPGDKTITSLFEQQVNRTPDNTAVEFDGTILTYKELNKQANQLSDYLRLNYKVQAGDLIGIKLDRTEWMIIALLSVLKSGGAYVPVDMAYPGERIAYILSDSKCKVVIDTEELMKFRQEQHKYKIGDPPSVNKTGDLAYVIYTSGSTGQPKGVMVEHGSTGAFISWCKKEFGNSDFDTVLGVTSICFDLSVFEIFYTICSGKKLFLLQDALSVPQYINTAGNILLNTVPSVVGALLGGADGLGQIKVLNMAGEPIPADFISRLDSGKIEIRNLYGPSETTTYSTVYRIQADRPGLIGRPISNTEVYILSESERLQPVGIPGEICIGGHGLSRGYLNQPELTAQKFVPNPFRLGERMYKTGDWGRWSVDGNIEFIGRTDDQIKIRGYRIEPGEIENALRRHEDIEASVVIARANRSEEKELVAYVVSGVTLNPADLRSFLSTGLPAYMLPTHYVQLKELPLTANGKIDKKGLPDPEGLGLPAGIVYEAAESEQELHLIAVFEEVLRKKPIGRKDNFFVLGGDSIKSIQAIARLKRRGYSIPVRDIMLYPVIEDLARRINIVSRSISQAMVEETIPLSPVQIFFLDSDLKKDKHHFNQSVLLYSRTPVSEEGIRAALAKIVLHHDALRMVYRKSPEGWVQQNRGEEQSYDLEVIEHRADISLATYCDRIQSGIDLENGPLIKAALFRGPGGDHILLVVHHLVIDGVSWRILFEDLSSLYQQYMENQPLALPLKTDSFSYWQHVQLEYSRTAALVKEEPYWTSVESAPVSPLPLEDPEGSNLIKDETSCFFWLDGNYTHRLLTQCYQAYHTEINDILLTGLSLALAEALGLRNVLVKLEGHGREDIGTDVDISRTVGWFTTMYPVRFDMSYSKDIIRQLVEVKETLHRVPNKGIGYGILRYLGKRDYKLAPGIVFNYLGDFGSGIKTEKGSSLFEFSGDYRGKEVSDDISRDAVLDVSGMIADEKLQLVIKYSNKQYSVPAIESLLDSYRRHLTDLIDRLSAEKNEHLSPVDLTYKGLSVEQLQKLNKLLC